MMIQLDYPWLLLLLPLPLLVYLWLPAFQPQQQKLRVPFTRLFGEQLQGTSTGGVAGFSWFNWLMHGSLWLLLLLAAARPVLLEPPLQQLELRRDLVLAIDFSQSMEARDIKVVGQPDGERLAVVKQAAAGFIQQRPTDRIGLIAFADSAFALAPPSAEHDSLLRILSMSESGMAGANTALGDAIGVALRLLENSQMAEKVLLLLTDGNDNRSLLDPLQAARIARERGLIIHTIGFGRIDPAQDDAVDVTGLQQIAAMTGGQAFLASDQQALTQVYAAIDSMTPDNAKVLQAQPRRELFWLLLLPVWGLLALQVIVAALAPRWPALSAGLRQREADR